MYNENEINPKKLEIFIFLFFISIIIAVILFFTFSTKIQAGYVGIKVNLYGQEKGVDIETMKTGRNFYNIITSDVYKFPSFLQQIEYNNISFQDIDGLKIEADIGISYKFISEKIPSIYEEYRASPDKIIEEYMLVWTRNAINSISSKYKVDQIYGESKEKFRNEIKDFMIDNFENKGISIQDVYFTGTMILPDEVMSRISQKINATQEAIKKENELRAVEAESKKKIAEAEGFKNSEIIKSEGIAMSIIEKAKAESEANKMINQSLNKNIIEYKKIERWNGEMPKYLGDSNTLLNISE